MVRTAFAPIVNSRRVRAAAAAAAAATMCVSWPSTTNGLRAEMEGCYQPGWVQLLVWSCCLLLQLLFSISNATAAAAAAAAAAADPNRRPSDCCT
jgi:hypothetical protein